MENTNEIFYESYSEAHGPLEILHDPFLNLHEIVNHRLAVCKDLVRFKELFSIEVCELLGEL